MSNLFLRRCLVFTTFLIVFLLSVGCQKSKNTQDEVNISETNKDSAPQVIEVVTSSMDFQLPKNMPSGWTTFAYSNNSSDPHFMLIEKMPEGIRIEDYKNDLIPPFLAAFNHFNEGNPEAGMKEFEKIPEWFSRVELAGGVGLTSGHTASESTLFLKPGAYVIECYVRMPTGLPHTFMGMLEEFVVSDSINSAEPPTADLEISLSSETGVSMLDTIKSGTYTFSVDFKDQKIYEHMLGHDINLIKIENNSSIDSLGAWLNTGNFKAFRTPAPKGFIFLGGAQDLPTGERGYFRATLEPGDYVLISEIPNTIERKMYKRFTVRP